MNASSVGNGYVVIAALLWGTTGTAARLAPDLSPITIAAVAMGIGGLLQALLAWSAITTSLSLLAKQRRLLVSGACAVAIYPLAFYSAMDFAGVAVGTVVSIGSAPLFSAFIENRLERSPLSKQWWLGAIIGVSGIILLAQHPNSTPHAASDSAVHFLIGIGLGLVAGLTYAFYSWAARTMMLQGMTSRAAMGATFGLGGLLLLPLLVYTGAPLLHTWRNATVGGYMALFPMCVGYLCYGAGLARIKSSVATAITLLEPVVAALLAVVVLNEALSPSAWLGIALIVGSLGVIAWPTRRITP